MKLILNRINISPHSIEGIDITLFHNHNLEDVSNILNTNNFKLYSLEYFNQDDLKDMEWYEVRQLIDENEYEILCAWECIVDKLSKTYDIMLSTWYLDDYFKDHKQYFVHTRNTKDPYNVGCIKYIDEEETNIDELGTLDIWLFGLYGNSIDRNSNKELNEIIKRVPFILYLYHEVQGSTPSKILINGTYEDLIKQVITNQFDMQYSIKVESEGKNEESNNW